MSGSKSAADEARRLARDRGGWRTIRWHADQRTGAWRVWLTTPRVCESIHKQSGRRSRDVRQEGFGFASVREWT
jgi:hypothetical protein